jgi:hypothetical protein
VLNHVSGHKAGVAGTYNVAEYRAEKQAALTCWTQHVAGLVSDKPRAKVLPMKHKAKALHVDACAK